MVLTRAVIEATAKDKSIVVGGLAAKIDELAVAELIRPAVRDAAHEVRHLGNDMAHGDFIEPVDAANAEAAVAIMGEILAEVYQGPARVVRLRERRQAKTAGPATTSAYRPIPPPG